MARSDCIPRVLLVDAHRVGAEGTKLLLNASGAVIVVGISHDLADAQVQARRLLPDVVVADLGCQVSVSGEAVSNQLSGFRPAQVLVYSDQAFGDRVNWNVGGAGGFLMKTATLDELIGAIHKVAKIKELRQPVLSGLARTRALSPREQETLTLVCDGLTSKEIASALGLSVRTIEAYKRGLMEKAGVRNTVALARFAFSTGYVRL